MKRDEIIERRYRPDGLVEEYHAVTENCADLNKEALTQVTIEKRVYRGKRIVKQEPLPAKQNIAEPEELDSDKFEKWTLIFGCTDLIIWGAVLLAGCLGILTSEDMIMAGVGLMAETMFLIFKQIWRNL